MLLGSKMQQVIASHKVMSGIVNQQTACLSYTMHQTCLLGKSFRQHILAGLQMYKKL